MCELHGNTNIEACSVCGSLFYRNFGVRKEPNKARLTGRFCDFCKDVPLRYTTVAFSQSMPDLCLDKATVESRKSDLSICLGTSMRVSPACTLPLLGKKRNKDHKLVIVNLQKTPSDDECQLRIFARVDDVITRLFQAINQQIPEFTYLNLIENQEFLANFKANYPFRSAGSTDWFSGEHIPAIKDKDEDSE